MDMANPTLKLRKRRRLRFTAAAVTVLVVALAVLLLRLGPALPRADRSSLWIDTVQRGDMLREVRATGTLVPRTSRWLAAATAAQVEQILVWPGTAVQPGTVLMKLSNPEVQDSLRNAKAVARHLIPLVRYEQEQIALAQLKNRMQIEQERVNAFGGSMQAQLDAVKARLLQQQSNLQLRQRQADALDVKAGIAGVLQEVAVQEGAQVAAGANLARVARTDVLIARLLVPEVQAKDVAMGMPVNVDTHNGTVSGKVTRIDPAVRDGSVQVDVTLTGALPPGARPDLSVDGRIRIALLRNVLSVGRPALAKADGDISLFRLDKSGDTATRVPVRIGAASVDRVQILHGLKEGDQVILSDTSQWDKHDQIKIE